MPSVIVPPRPHVILTDIHALYSLWLLNTSRRSGKCLDGVTRRLFGWGVYREGWRGGGGGGGGSGGRVGGVRWGRPVNQSKLGHLRTRRCDISGFGH